MTLFPILDDRGVFGHLARGALAICLLALAGWLLASPGLPRGAIGIAALVSAVILLRGCPTCWLVGLCAALIDRNRKAQP